MSTTETFRGEINDLDSHEMTPPGLWSKMFHGVSTADAALDRLGSVFTDSVQDTFTENASSITDDRTSITDENVWKIKGTAAPGSFSPERRLEVLDFMGINRQLVFPGGVGLIAVLASTATPDTLAYMIGSDSAETADFDMQNFARGLARAHNDWAMRFAATNDRLRPVGVVITYSMQDAMSEIERVIDGGLRAVVIPSSIPPDGVSPADPSLDPMWRMLEEADMPVVLHIGGEFQFMKTDVWHDVPQFQRIAPEGLQEVPVDAYTLATAHLSAENFLTTMILGGVFDRFPGLRFGVIELGAQWIGAMSVNLDQWANMFKKKLNLSMAPSAFIRRNVRVTPFFFEPVDQYIDRYGLEDVYCFATDYPHIEGGTSPMQDHADRLSRHGEEIMRKFFVENAALLLPE
jgi:predicted TIM-barrel fold metal-dependent hydrolase